MEFRTLILEGTPGEGGGEIAQPEDHFKIHPTRSPT